MVDNAAAAPAYYLRAAALRITALSSLQQWAGRRRHRADGRPL